MSSLIDRIERHTENNMKIKAKYSKEIEHLRYQVSMLERENEELRLDEQRGGQNLQRELEALDAQKGDLEAKVAMLQGELDIARNGLEEARRNQGNLQREQELETQMEGLRAQLLRNEEELRVAKNIAEEERQKGGRERSEMEVEKHKMELNVEHWRGQSDQLQREIQNLRDMLDYEKNAKIRLEDRVKDLEGRSFGRWSNNQGNFAQGRGGPGDMQNQRGNPPDLGNNYGTNKNFSGRQDQNQNHYNKFGDRNTGYGTQKKEDIVFGKPTFPNRGTSPGIRSGRRRSNSPFATDQKLDVFNQQGNSRPTGNYRPNMGTNSRSNMGRNSGANTGANMGRNMGGNMGGNMGDNLGRNMGGGYGRGGMDQGSSRGGGRNELGGGRNGLGGGQNGLGGGGDFGGNPAMSRREDDRWGNSRGWGNNAPKPDEDTGALDSIASKRMAVRRGRGRQNKVNNSKQSGQPKAVLGRFLKTSSRCRSRRRRRTQRQ